MVTERVAALRRWMATVLERLHRLAESGWGGTSAFLWGVGQSSVVPGPAEAVLIPLGLADPPKAWRLAAWTFGGTLLGGLIAFAIGFYAFDVVRPMFGIIGIGEAELERLRALAGSHGPLLVLVSAMTPISTKVVSIAAGAFGLPIEAFVATLAVARGARLFAIATILRYAGSRLANYLVRRPRDEADGRRDAGEAGLAGRDAGEAALAAPDAGERGLAGRDDAGRDAPDPARAFGDRGRAGAGL
jgi:membrane protein YqaA with SNARE-associated domain